MTKQEAKKYLIDLSYKLGTTAIEELTLEDGEKMRKAIEALDETEEDREINVGDEVRWYNERIVITRLYYNGGFNWCDGINQDGVVFNVLEEKVTKTGRHFSIESLLKEMGNEQCIS